MECPYCGVRFSLDGVGAYHMPVNFTSPVLGRTTSPHGEKQFTISAHYCPECSRQMMWLNELSNASVGEREVVQTSLLFPKYQIALLPEEVPQEYSEEYTEAAHCLPVSPKASAALSRRTLQRLIREKEGIREKSLLREIEVLLERKVLPVYLAEDLDAIRHVGNFAAHPIEDGATGEIIEVEPGEAEWTLGVLSALLAFYFVDVATSAKRRAALNMKPKCRGPRSRSISFRSVIP